ncbi:MAG: hypothetical protein Q4Q07_05965 [Tissierellia bacterium]|nr:hypothetical protein [Tissierellia bacterium]
MEAILALTYVFVVYAIGDFISVKTKSVVSMLFTASVLFLIGFWVGVPVDVFETSQLLGIGAVLIVVLLTHMGTLLNIRQLIEQWRTVAIAIGGILGIAIFLFIVGSPILGKETAIVAAPPISGGIVAGLQMGEAAAKIGRDDLQILAILLVVVQGFIGYPVASFCLQKVGRDVLDKFHKGELEDTSVGTVSNETRTTLIPPLSEKYASANMYLAKTAIIALLATLAGNFTANTPIPIDKNIMALIFGIIAAEIGFLERDIMTKANSFGLAMAALLVVIFNGLSKATPEIILQLLPKIFISLVLGVIGISIASFIVGKLVKESFYMSFAIGVTALFGFPGTFVVSNEVASSLAKTPEEKEAILSVILPKMLVAGFITVSIASVFLAGFMAKLLV